MEKTERPLSNAPEWSATQRLLDKMGMNQARDVLEPPDLVNHPSHYTNKEVECIDWMAMFLTDEEFEGYLKGNILKYIWRHKDKGNPCQDLEKAGWYLERLKRLVHEHETAKLGS